MNFNKIYYCILILSVSFFVSFDSAFALHEDFDPKKGHPSLDYGNIPVLNLKTGELAFTMDRPVSPSLDLSKVTVDHCKPFDEIQLAGARWKASSDGVNFTIFLTESHLAKLSSCEAGILPKLYLQIGALEDDSGIENRHVGLSYRIAGASVVVPVTPVTGPPATPTNLTVRHGDSNVKLSWIPSNSGGQATDYIIEYSPTKQNNWEKFFDGENTRTRVTVTGLSNGATYDFRVSASNSAGTSLPSKFVSSTPFTIPAAPTGLVATPDDTKVTLSWNKPYDGGAPITDYKIEHRANGSWKTFFDGENTRTRVTVTGLSNGATYDFRVSASNSAGTSLPSYVVSTTVNPSAIAPPVAPAVTPPVAPPVAPPPQPITPVTSPSAPTQPAIPVTSPSAPTNVLASPGNSKVTLSWNEPSDNGGAPITDYIIQYRFDGSWVTFNDGTSTRTFATVTGLTNGMLYEFVVIAANTSNTSQQSDIVISIPSENLGADEHLIRTVGVLVPTSGSLSDLGILLDKTIHHAVEKFNESLASQNKDWRLGITVYNDGGTPSGSLVGIKTFNNAGIKTVIGPASSDSLAAVIEYIDENNMLSLGYGSTASTLAINDNVFRLAVNDDNLALLFSKLLIDDQISHVIPVYRDDEWGRALHTTLSELLGDITFHEGIKYSPQDPNYTEIISQLEQHQYDNGAVILLGFAELQHILDMAAASDSLADFKWYASDFDTKSLLEDSKRAQFMSDVGYTIATVSVPENPLNEELDQLIPGSNLYTFAAYDSVFILGNAIDAAGSTDTILLAKAIPRIAVSYDGALYDTTLNEYGDLAHVNYDVKTVQNRSLVDGNTYAISNTELSDGTTLDVTVFHDINYNGVKDAGEDGVQTLASILTLPPLQAYTNASGEYTFSSPPSGIQTVYVAVPSGFELSPGMQNYRNVVIEGKTSVEFPLVTMAPDTGTVTVSVTSNGVPVKSALVRLESTPPRTELTNHMGTFTFEGVLPGTYDVLVASASHKPSNSTVVVTGDANYDVKINLQPLNLLTGTISGIITPNVSAIITIDTTPPRIINVDTTGAFTISDVEIGTYNIHVRSAGYQSFSDTIVVTRNATSTINVNLNQLNANTELTVIIFNDNDNNSKYSTGDTLIPDVTIVLADSTGNAYKADTDSFGTATFDNLTLQRHTIYVIYDSETIFETIDVASNDSVYVALN